MGVPPTILWGRVRRSAVSAGITEHDPEWTGFDLTLVSLYDEYVAGLCACGMPMSEHDGKTAADYAAPFIHCPALEALERDQTARAKQDGDKDAKPDPTRPRLWRVMPRAAVQAWADSIKAAKATRTQ